MTVWLSQMNSIDTDDGVKSGVKVATRELETDANGEVSFDLTDLEIEEIIDYAIKGTDAVTNILSAVNVTVKTVGLTAITVIAYTANSAIPSLTNAFNPVILCGSGKKVRLTIYYI